MLPEVPVGSQIIAEEGHRKAEDGGPQHEEEIQEGVGEWERRAERKEKSLLSRLS